MLGFSNKDRIKRPITGLGTLVALGGLSGLFPGVKDVVLAIIAKTGGTANPEVPVYLAAIFLALGILMVVGDQIAAFKKSSDKTLIAFRHHSLQEVPASPLTENDIPRRLGAVRLEHKDCNQTAEMSVGGTGPNVALGVQDRERNWLSQRLQSTPRPDYAYYGVAHIPFQILMGCQLSQTNPLLLELSRQDRTWKELKQGHGPSVGLTVTENRAKLRPTSIVIRISVSYPINMEDIRAIISDPFDDIELRVKNPGIDQITHYNQIHDVAAVFRSVLDSSMQRLAPGGQVHLFYSGPMSLGFSLGKVISPTNHPQVTAYNHTRQSDPRYSWGITINSPNKLSTVVNSVAARGQQG